MDLGQLDQLMRQAADQNPALSVPATQQLATISKQPGYTQALIQVFSQSVNTPFGLWCSIALKSHILQYWEVGAGEDDVLSAEDRAAVRTTLVQMLLGCPPTQKAQIIHAIGIVSVSDFPQKWNTLIQELSSKLGSGPAMDAVIFEAIHTVCLQYRSIEQTDSNSEVIRYVQDSLFPTMMPTLLQTIHTAEGKLTAIHQGDSCLTTKLQGTIKGVEISTLTYELQEIIYMLETFLDLHSLDGSAFAQGENLALIFRALFSLFAVPPFNIPSGLPDYTGSAVDAIHRLVVKIINLFASKYDEQFVPHMEQALQVIWGVLLSRDNTPRYDGLLCTCLQFLAQLAKSSEYAASICHEEKLNGIVNMIVINHIPARQDDIDAVTDDESYLERELISNANDQVSKRGAIIELIRALMISSEETMCRLLWDQINIFTQRYQSSPSANWTDIETALVLLVAMGVGTTATPRDPTTIQYLSATVVPLLNQFTTTSPPSPLLVISALKALATYRQLIPEAAVIPMLGVLVHYISSDEHIIASYSAYCVSIFVGSEGIVKKTQTEGIALDLISALFASLETHHENHYILAAILTVIGAAPLQIIPLAADLTQKMFKLLEASTKELTNQRYLYLLFELLAITMRIVLGNCTPESKQTTLDQLESLLFPSFQHILATPDLHELFTYVLTIMSMFLEERSNNTPQFYIPIFPVLLQAELWKTNANIPSLVRFIGAFLHNNSIQPTPALEIDNQQVTNSILGIYQKLLKSKSNLPHAFRLAQYVAAYTPIFTSNLTVTLRMLLGALSEFKDNTGLRVHFSWLVSFWVTNGLLIPGVEFNQAKTRWITAEGFSLPNDDFVFQQIQEPSHPSFVSFLTILRSISPNLVEAFLTRVFPQALESVQELPDKKLLFRMSMVILRALGSQGPVSNKELLIKYLTTDIKRICMVIVQNQSVQQAALQQTGEQGSHVVSAFQAWSIENRSNVTKPPEIVLRCTIKKTPVDFVEPQRYFQFLFTQEPSLAEHGPAIQAALSGQI